MSRAGIGAACIACALMASAHAQEKVGQVLFALGKVERVAPDGATTALSQGDALFEGDLVRSGAQSHAQVIMVDEALIALRPGSRLRLAAYRYSGKEEGSERATLELIKGAFRSITGGIGRSHKANYRIESGAYVLGVRGTDHETFLVPSGQGAGVYNHVSEGATYLQGPRGRIDLDAGETGYGALGADAGPRLLERMPEFMHASFPPAAADSGPPPREEAQRIGKALGRPERAPRALGERGIGEGGRCGGPCRGSPEGKGRAGRPAR